MVRATSKLEAVMLRVPLLVAPVVPVTLPSIVLVLLNVKEPPLLVIAVELPVILTLERLRVEPESKVNPVLLFKSIVESVEPLF